MIIYKLSSIKILNNYKKKDNNLVMSILFLFGNVIFLLRKFKSDEEINWKIY